MTYETEDGSWRPSPPMMRKKSAIAPQVMATAKSSLLVTQLLQGPLGVSKMALCYGICRLPSVTFTVERWLPL